MKKLIALGLASAMLMVSSIGFAALMNGGYGSGKAANNRDPVKKAVMTKSQIPTNR